MSKTAKKIAVVVGLLIAGFLIWYLFLKPYDYLVTFKANTTAGTINQSLKQWSLGLEGSNTVQQENLNSLTQKININDTVYLYNWKKLKIVKGFQINIFGMETKACILTIT